jgi:exonuclease VII large subunit
MADAKPRIYSISELTRWIRLTLEKSVGMVWVEGEISNLHYHPSAKFAQTPEKVYSGEITPPIVL